jgi:uncharacterized membrane protein YhaH (DUF805 family)
MVAIHQDLFGAPRQGRMARLAFVIYASAIQLAVLVYFIWVIVATGLAEQAVDLDPEKALQQLNEILSSPLTAGMAELATILDLEKAQQQSSELFSPALLVLSGVFLLALFYALLNVVAKRVRDIGLPGWWAILAYVIVRVIISAAGFPWVGLLFDLLATLLLCFVVTDAVGRQGDS